MPCAAGGHAALHLVARVAADAANEVLRPVAQRYPVGLTVGAVVLGGLLAWSRPWRWVITPALFAGLLPQVLSKAAAEVPGESWLVMLASLAQRPDASAAPPAP